MYCVPLTEYLANADAALDFVKAALADQHARHPEISVGECLKKRTFLRSLVGPDYPDFMDQAALLAGSGADALEALRPELHRIMGERHSAVLQEEVIHCFRYEVDAAGRCYFHIRNPKMPESFLDDEAFVIAEFRRIMDEAAARHGCRELYTVTWLNSLARFQHFFPAEWLENMNTLPADNVGPTLGWQGQFINRKGLLNRQTADYYLQYGVLRYPRAESCCSFEAMQRHLKTLRRADTAGSGRGQKGRKGQDGQVTLA